MNSLASKIVEAAIDEVNLDQPSAALISKSPDAQLLSTDSEVDSLTLVRLLVTIERLVEETAGKSVVVVDESAFESEQSPFNTVGSLTRHVESLLA
jgi:acyl carrier protein